MIWRVEHDRRAYVLRVFPPAHTGRFDDELAVMTSARTGGIPVAEVAAAGARHA